MTAYNLLRPIDPPDRFTVAIIPACRDDQTPELRFEADGGGLILSIKFEVAQKRAALTTLGYEGVVLPHILYEWPVGHSMKEIKVDVLVGVDRLKVCFGFTRCFELRGALAPASIAKVRVLNADVQSLQHMGSPIHALNWRRCAQPSGSSTVSNPFVNNETLLPGVSFIVRAKNEAENIAACLAGITPFAQEIIFIDNGSTDDTLQIAKRLAEQHANIRVFRYPVQVPRVGRQHAEAVLAGSSNTLGEYYNWALSHATCFNFTKWDADFLTIPRNMSEMYSTLDLATRGDNICLYYSGMEVYTDGESWWVDEATMQHEYRLFSKLHRCSWVDIPPWEEVDQTYLFKSRKVYYEKPVYLEIFRLDRDEFASRGLYLRDARDRARFNYLQHYVKYGQLPSNFTKVSGPEDPAFAQMKLTSEHRRMRSRAHAIWSSIPSIYKGGRNLLDSSLRLQQASLIVLIVSCEKNSGRIAQIRQSWAKDLVRLGITFHFVVGRLGQQSELIGDVLYLDCPDTYEGLPLKTRAMMTYFVESTSCEYLLKVDDDVVLDPEEINQSKYYCFDYLGGVVAGSWGIEPEWHFGKCSDKQLNAISYSGSFLGTWYAGGCGYFLSRRFAHSALSQPDVFSTELYEDKALCDALRISGAVFGDLRDTFSCLDAGKIMARCEIPYLLTFDVPSSASYEELLRTMRAARSTRPSVPEYNDDASALDRVVTDWCDINDFFQSELLSEVFSR